MSRRRSLEKSVPCGKMKTLVGVSGDIFAFPFWVFTSPANVAAVKALSVVNDLTVIIDGERRVARLFCYLRTTTGT